ncbi:MAG: pyruvate kinase [Candidatus Roizmanbacteria bacterium]|nr:pyruvate kinase [Candidatus Roizmanbacteria bacterium]
MQKLTKIVATIGPASDSEAQIESLIKAGVNVFRFNFKHNTVEWHSERIERVCAIAKRMEVHVGTLIDLQGPEIRIKLLEDTLTIHKGMRILLDELSYIKENHTNGAAFSISHPSIIPHLKQGQYVVADDGAFEFTLDIKDGRRYLVSQSEGTLKANKTLNIPGADFPFPVLIDRDMEGLQLVVRNEIDFIALSFVRSAEDIRTLRKEMNTMHIDSQIVAKIETKRAIDDLTDIINESDGLMVARGDLAVELAREQVPYQQKQIIRMCLEQGKFVITATQMLESMITNPYPTRAEVSDIANAVFDHTSAVMLSAESAAGKYPLEAVKMMAKTAQYNEQVSDEDVRTTVHFPITDQESLLCSAAYELLRSTKTMDMEISGFIILTETGRTAHLLSRYRPKLPIFAFCPTSNVAESLTVEFGIVPFVQGATYLKEKEVTGGHVRATLEYLLKHALIVSGQRFIVLHGDKWAEVGGTSTVKIVTA